MSQSLITALCILFLPGSLLFAQKLEWKTMGAMPPGYEGYPIGLSLAIAPDGVWYGTGMASGVWRSSDSSKTWTRCNGTMDTVSIGSVFAIDNGDLFATHGYGQHMYKSTDDGQTWTPVDIGIHNDSVRYPQLLSRNGLIYLYGVEGYLKVSHNLGTSWESIDIEEAGNIINLAFDSSGGMLVCGSRLRRQKPSGEWEVFDIGFDEWGRPTGAASVAVISNGQIWASSSEQLIRQGSTWGTINPPQKYDYGYQIAVALSGHFIYSSQAGLFTSADYGQTWINHSKGKGEGRFYLDKHGHVILYTMDSIYRSTRSLYEDTVELPEGPLPCLPKMMVNGGPVQDVRLMENQLLFGFKVEIGSVAKVGDETLVIRQTMQPELVGSILTKNDAFYFSTYGVRYGGEDRGGIHKYVAGPNAPRLIDLTNVVQIEERDNYLYLLRAGRTKNGTEDRNGEIWRYNLSNSQSLELLSDSLAIVGNMVVTDSIFFSEYGDGVTGSISAIALDGGTKRTLTRVASSRIVVTPEYIFSYSPSNQAIVRYARDRSDSSLIASIQGRIVDLVFRANRLYYITNDGCETNGSLVCLDLTSATSAVISDELQCPNKIAVDGRYVFVAKGSIDSSVMRFCIPAETNSNINIANAQIAFGKVTVSESKTELITLRNDGDEDLTIFGSLNTSGVFTLTPPTMEIPAKCSASFKLQYTPKSEVKHYATAFFHSIGSVVLSVQIEGEGLAKSKVRPVSKLDEAIFFENSSLTIEGPPNEQYQVALFDITGKLVLERTVVTRENISLVAANIVKGTYFVQATSGSKTYRRTISY